MVAAGPGVGPIGIVNIVSTEAAQAIDRRSIDEFHYTSAMLMESAAIHIWRRLAAHIDVSASVVVLCGPGNNGGDGLALARWAHNDGRSVSIIDCTGGRARASDLNRTHSAICGALGISVCRWHDERARALSLIKECDHIIDAVTGVGIGGPLRDYLHELVSAVNERQRHTPVYAVDVPSGLSDAFEHSYPAIRVSITYTVGLPKQFCFTPLARPYCGDIVVVPIGFPAPLIADHDRQDGELLTVDHINQLYTPPSRFGYKHTRGVVALYGGGEATTGAVIMAADGTAAAGAGLIHLFPRAERSAGLGSSRPAYIVHRPAPRSAAGQAPSDIDTPPPGVDALSTDTPPPGVDALCIGPGWGVNDDTRALLDMLIAHGPPGVIDADAITLLSECVSLDGDTLTVDSSRVAADALRGWVLTPHCAEFARLLGVDTALILQNPLHYLNVCVRATQAVIILKSYVTYIINPDGRYAILDGNEVTLATAGSGDVLAGIVAALLAQGYEPFCAAKLATLIHYHAGRTAREKYGYYRADALAACVARNMLSYGVNR